MQSYKLLIFIIVTAVLLLSGCSPKSSTNKELAEMVEQDQLDRLQGYIDKSNDLARLKRVQELEKNGGLRHPLDYYNAALIYQHGISPQHYLKAHLLSKEALKRDPNLGKARWLSCAAEDRYLLSLGKAQVWGRNIW